MLVINFQKCIVSFKLLQERVVPVKIVCAYVFTCVLDILERWMVEGKAASQASEDQHTYFRIVLQNVCQTSPGSLFLGIFSLNIVFFSMGQNLNSNLVTVHSSRPVLPVL